MPPRARREAKRHGPSSRDGPHGIASTLGSVVAKRPLVVVAVAGLLTLVSIYGASTLEREPGFLSVLPESPETDAFFRAVDLFENTEFTFYVFQADDPDLITAQGASTLLDFQQRVESTPRIADRLKDSPRGSVLNPAAGPVALVAASQGEDPRRIDLADFARQRSDLEIKQGFAAFYAGPVYLPGDLLDDVRGALSFEFDATPRIDPGWALAPGDASGDAPLDHLDLLRLEIDETPSDVTLRFHVASWDSHTSSPTAGGAAARYQLVATNPHAPAGLAPLSFALGVDVVATPGGLAPTPYLAYRIPGATPIEPLPVEQPINGTARVARGAESFVEVVFERQELLKQGVLPLLPVPQGEELVGTTWTQPYAESRQASDPSPVPELPGDLPELGAVVDGVSAPADRWPDTGAGQDRLTYRIPLAGLEAEKAAVVLLVDTEFGGTSAENQDRVAEVQEAAYEEAQAVAQGPVSFLGPSATWKRVEEEEQRIQDRSIYAVMVVGVILAFLFRRLSDVVISLASLGMLLAWTFGFAALVGFKLNVATSIAPFILIGVGVDYSIHTLRYLTEGRARGLRNAKLVAWALVLVGTALVLATVTTMVGFLSNILSPIRGFRAFGVLTAAGILFALIANVTFAPAARLLVARRHDRKGRAPVVRGLATRDSWKSVSRATGLFRRYPWASTGLAVALALTGALALADLGTAYDYRGQLPADSPIVTAYTALEEDFGLLSERAFLLVEGDISTQASLAAIDTATRRLENATLPGPFEVESLTRVMRQASNASSLFHDLVAAQMIQTRDADGDGLPDVDIEPVVGRLRSAFPVEMGLLSHRDAGTTDATTVIVRSNLINVEDQRHVWRALEDAAPALQAAGLRATATGLPVTEVVANDAIIDSVVLITAGVIGASLVVLTAVYRRRVGSWVLGTLVTLPVLLTLGWTVLLAWVLGIHLNAVTSIVGAVLVGLGIDYSIHYAHRYVSEREGGLTPDAAHEATLGSTGINLGAAVLTTIGSLSILLFSPQRFFLEFGVLLVSGLVMALGAAVLALPPILALWERHTDRFPTRRPNP